MSDKTNRRAARRIVIHMMEQKNQDPFILSKMDKIMEECGYKIIHYEIKDINLCMFPRK